MGADTKESSHKAEPVELELDRLVEDEVAAIGDLPDTAIEDDLARVMERLRDHPDRLALLERLRHEVLGPKQEPEPAPTAEPPAAEGKA